MDYSHGEILISALSAPRGTAAIPHLQRVGTERLTTVDARTVDPGAAWIQPGTKKVPKRDEKGLGLGFSGPKIMGILGFFSCFFLAFMGFYHQLQRASCDFFPQSLGGSILPIIINHPHMSMASVA